MSNKIAISPSDIFRQICLSGQIPAVVEDLVIHQIIVREAQKRKIEVETTELQQAADKFRLENELLSAEATWSWLQKHHLSLDEFEEMISHRVLSSKLAQHIFIDRVEPFFVEHQLDYQKVAMYEIILDDCDLAMELFFALQEEEIHFWEIARQYVRETEQRRCFGYRGLLRRSELKPEISTVIFAANPPQILKPIIVGKKAHLVFVEEIIEPQLDNELRSQILADLFSDWLKQQLNKFETELLH